MAIAFINAATKFVDTTTNSIATDALSLTTGNFLFVGIRTINNALVTTMSDTAGNVFHQLFQSELSGNEPRLEIWFACDVIGNASNVVTANLSQSVNSRGIGTLQFSGIADIAPVDVVAWARTAGATTLTSDAFTTTVPDAVIISFAHNNNTGGGWTLDSGYSLGATDASGVCHSEYKIVSALQSAVTHTVSTAPDASSKVLGIGVFHEALVGVGSGGSPISGGGGGVSRSRFQRRM